MLSYRSSYLLLILSMFALVVSACAPAVSSGSTQFETELSKREAFDLSVETITGTRYELPQNPNVDFVGWVIDDANFDAGFLRASLVETENIFALGLKRKISLTFVSSPSGTIITLNNDSFAQRAVELEKELLSVLRK